MGASLSTAQLADANVMPDGIVSPAAPQGRHLLFGSVPAVPAVSIPSVIAFAATFLPWGEDRRRLAGRNRQLEHDCPYGREAEFSYYHSQIDKDGSGGISFDELKTVLTTNTHVEVPPDTEIQALINEADYDGNNEIGVAEFSAQICRNVPVSEGEVASIFNYIDQNGDGQIEVDELRWFMTGLGIKLSDADLDEMIRQVDSDGSGTVSYNEFRLALQNTFG